MQHLDVVLILQTSLESPPSWLTAGVQIPQQQQTAITRFTSDFVSCGYAWRTAWHFCWIAGHSTIPQAAHIL